MNRSESIADLAGALAKAQAKIEGAVKGNTNPAFRSRYADLGAVWDAIREPLTSAGIAVLQQLSTADNRVCCTTILTHASGQWIEFEPFAVPTTKQDAQGFGSAATYARRYSLMAAVGIAPIDDDGEAAVGRSGGSQGHSSAPAPAAVPTGLLEAARTSAMEGVESFRAYWSQLSPKYREALKAHLPALKEAAEAADNPEPANVG